MNTTALYADPLLRHTTTNTGCSGTSNNSRYSHSSHISSSTSTPSSSASSSTSTSASSKNSTSSRGSLSSTSSSIVVAKTLSNSSDRKRRRPPPSSSNLSSTTIVTNSDSSSSSHNSADISPPVTKSPTSFADMMKRKLFNKLFRVLTLKDLTLSGGKTFPRDYRARHASAKRKRARNSNSSTLCHYAPMPTIIEENESDIDTQQSLHRRADNRSTVAWVATQNATLINSVA